jgi:S-adenosylmethionine hydrolase
MPSTPRIVTLTTDFGSGSVYVAELKGRLLHAATPFTLVDIAHDVPAHDIRAAAWLVARACFTFPAGTLHVIVVDPGVGTARRLVWVRLEGWEQGGQGRDGQTGRSQDFLCPDNGVLSLAVAAHPLVTARELAVDAAAAATFHGRDVLAPAAVRLLGGAAADTLGPPVDRLVRLPWPVPRETAVGIEGEVIHVDTFGNLITNLPATLLPRLAAAGRLRVGGHTVRTIVRTYGDAAPGTAVALVGSQGFIEAALVQGRAAERFGGGLSTPVMIPTIPRD